MSDARHLANLQTELTNARQRTEHALKKAALANKRADTAEAALRAYKENVRNAMREVMKGTYK